MFPIVMVKWEDATNSGEWNTLEGAQKFEDFEFNYHCYSVGYLIRDDDECVILASRATRDFSNVGLVERIPRGMVHEVVTIRKASQ